MRATIEIISSWQEFSNKLDEWSDPYFMFRGVTAAKYELVPKVGREQTNGNKYDAGLERVIFNEFKNCARAFLPYPPNTDLEWLIIGQHHGLPTRLLDWSTSPLVAAFFAVEKMGAHYRREDEPEEDYMPAIYIAPLPANDPNDYTRDDFELFPHQHYENYNGFILPPHISPRISIQKSLLTLHGKPNEVYKPNGLKKALIKNEFAAKLKGRLDNLGISRSTLFPGLDGIAADLAWFYKWRGS